MKTRSLAQYKLEFSMENQVCLAIENSQKYLFQISCLLHSFISNNEDLV